MMTKTLEDVLAMASALPEDEQDRLAGEMMALLKSRLSETAGPARSLLDRLDADPALEKRVSDALERGEHDIQAGRVFSVDAAFDGIAHATSDSDA